MYLGDLKPGDVLDFNFDTILDSGTNGALANLVSGALLVYKGASNTGNAVGATLTANVYSLAQSSPHHVTINTGANSTFYVGASDYNIVLTAGTVGVTSVVGSALGTFSILNRSPLQSTTTGQVNLPPATSGTMTLCSTVTTLTTLPAITAGWITATGIAANAFNGKGDWLLASSAPTNFSSLNVTAGGAVLTQAATAGTMTLVSTVTTLTNGLTITAGTNGGGTLTWGAGSVILPANNASLNISSAGAVLAQAATAGTVTGITLNGQALSSTGPGTLTIGGTSLQVTADTSGVAAAVWNVLTNTLTTPNSIGAYVLTLSSNTPLQLTSETIFTRAQ